MAIVLMIATTNVFNGVNIGIRQPAGSWGGPRGGATSVEPEPPPAAFGGEPPLFTGTLERGRRVQRRG